MEFNLNIPLQEMEELEFKYGIKLHINQFSNGTCSFYEIDPWGNGWYCGSTIEEVKENFESRYGY